MTFLKPAFIIIYALLSQVIFAQPVPALKPTTAATQAEVSAEQEELLQEMLATMKEIRQERAALNQQLKRTPDPAAAEPIKNQLAALDQRLQDLKNSFEEVVAGGFTLAELTQKAEDAPFTWQQELDQIMRPLLDELKQLTERPRLMEQLKSERAVQERRLEMANAAITQLKETHEQAGTASVKEAIKTLIDKWDDHRENAEGRLQRINTQLERLETSGEKLSEELVVKLQAFASGRGLSILLALGGFIFTYLILTGLGHAISHLLNRGRKPGTRRMARVITLLIRMLTIVLALLAAMLALYVRGDWLLLGLLILVVIGLAWGLQKSLPRYIREIRILLNMGGVREGERIIYDGLPWKIVSLNLFSTLYNPMLHGGGIIRLPIDQLAGMQSRPYSQDEPWFPSKEGDFVFLDGDVYGKVLLQTPEVVQVQIVGATTTFSVADYLGKSPRNLSRDGFAIPIVFGLDYEHQDIILSDILPKLRAHLEEQLAQQPFHPYLNTLMVEFNEAASSSLNVIIVATFTGAAAADYWPIRRFLQRQTVSACNHFGWVIPFDQLTVHLPSAEPALSQEHPSTQKVAHYPSTDND